MKADAKHTFEDVATALCKGAAPPDWVIAKLRKYAAFVADTAEDQGDEIDRLLAQPHHSLTRQTPLPWATLQGLLGQHGLEAGQDQGRFYCGPLAGSNRSPAIRPKSCAQLQSALQQ